MQVIEHIEEHGFSGSHPGIVALVPLVAFFLQSLGVVETEGLAPETVSLAVDVGPHVGDASDTVETHFDVLIKFVPAVFSLLVDKVLLVEMVAHFNN